MKALFEDAIGVAPPSTVDVDRLVARRKRIQRLQRVGTVGLAVTAVAAIGAVTSLLPDDGATAPTGTSSASAPALPPNPVDETPEQRAARYAAALRAIIAERVPGITVAGPFDFEAMARQGGFVPPEASAGPPMPPERHYTWRGTVSSPTGSAELGMAITRRQAGVAGEPRNNVRTLECPSAPLGRESCAVTTGPNGEQIRRRVADLNTYGTVPQILVSQVDVILPDLTWITVSCPHGGALGSPGAGSGEPVLTLDQLTAIAADPRLAW